MRVPTMPDGMAMAAAFVSATLGMAWLALAMDAHWKQAFGGAPGRRRPLLRGLGIGALMASLGFCLAADVASMAVLVWMMALALSALVVAFVLSWRPVWLRPLAVGRRNRPARRKR